IVVNAMEPRSGVAQYDPERQHWTLHVPGQGVFGFRNYIAGVFGVGRDKLRVLTDRVGGSFGMKQPTYAEYYCIMPAARGAGRPEANYYMERLVDAAAAEMGIDPVALRRRNHIPPEAMPYKAPNGTTYDSGDFTKLLNQALALADWDGFPARKTESRARGRLRGRGISDYLELTGPPG